MTSSAAAQIMRQADTVKNTMTDSGRSLSELWATRQKLEDLYKKMLLVDLEYALDKKVEQELWNHAFKNQISVLQTQSKDRQNPQKAEAHASLLLFLETASGFYLQFLQTICSTFKLDLPFRRRSAAFGVMRENIMNYKKIVTPKKSSCLYICCHCLVHLGDIARYRGDLWQAQTYYRHAANLSPNNGQPYNQLAILEASKGDKLSTVFYYVRSLAVRHPFPVAATNLEKFYSKLIKDTRSDFDGPNLTMTDIIVAFLQFHALLHMSTELERAAYLKTRITQALGGLIRSQSVSAAHLTGMAAISIFALHRSRSDAMDGGEPHRKIELSPDEEKTVQMHLSFSAKLLETMLQHTPKEDNKARDFPTLPAIKVMFDWLHVNRDVLSLQQFNNSSIWQDFCKLLNITQWLLNDSNKAADLSKYQDTPLPEDADLRCFQPLEPSYNTFNFSKSMSEELSAGCERDLRCQRLVAHGRWLAQEVSRLKLVVYQPGKSIRTQFSTQKVAQHPEGQQIIQKPSPRPTIAMQTIMRKKPEPDKSTSPLSVISEEGKSVPAEVKVGSEVNSQQGEGQKSATGGGVIKVNKAALGHNKPSHTSHKSGPPSQKPNLPPRLSGKAAGQKKGNARGGGNNSGQTGATRGNNQATAKSEIEARTEAPVPPPFKNSENYPSLSSDNYPALINQRTQASLIPTDNTSHNANSGVPANAPWGSMGMTRDTSSGPPASHSPHPASSPCGDSGSTASHSPQPSSNIPPVFIDQTSRSGVGEMSILLQSSTEPNSGLNFPQQTPSADFQQVIRSASQFVQQQQQQQGFPPSMLPPDISQQGYPRPNYSQQHRMLAQQQKSGHPAATQPHPVLQQYGRNQQPYFQGRPNVYQGDQNATLFNQPPPGGDNGNPRNSGGTGNNSGQHPVAGLTMPPPPHPSSRGMGQMMSPDSPGPNAAYQTSRGDSNGRGFSSHNGPAPVGFIPPPNKVDGGPYVTGGGGASTGRSGAHPLAGYRGMPMQNQQKPAIPQVAGAQVPGGQGSQSSGGLLYKNIPQRGHSAANMADTAGGSADPNSQQSAVNMYMTGGVVRPQSNQGQNQMQLQGHTQSQQQNLTFAATFMNQQMGAVRGHVKGSSQDSRQNPGFQGHPGTGSLTPDKAFPPDIGSLAHPSAQQMMKSVKGNQQQMYHQQRGGSQAQHQSMIHNMMDPAFLVPQQDRGADYKLWPTSLVKSTPQSQASLRQQVSEGGHGMNPMAAMNPNAGGPGNFNSAGGNLQGLWSNTGPSPLEKLLEQQKLRRQVDN